MVQKGRQLIEKERRFFSFFMIIAEKHAFYFGKRLVFYRRNVILMATAAAEVQL